MSDYKNVVVSIKGRQFMPEFGDVSNIELFTSGRLFHEKNAYVLTYSESELTGLEGTTTMLLIENSQVTLLRTGEMSAHMVFEQGTKHLSLYDTAEGSMTIGINASKVLSSVGENGGDLEMEYALEIDHSIAGENSIQIQIREAPEDTAPTPAPGVFVYDKFIN